MGNLKFVAFGIIAFVIFTAVSNNSGSDDGYSGLDLDQALSVASTSLTKFEGTENVDKDNVMDKFSAKYGSDLNATQPALHTGNIGVNSQEDGSFLAFDDQNNNQIKDANEGDLFKLEVDNENNRLIASNDEQVNEQGFSGSGLLMGMLLGNMMSRQRATGANPAAKKATPRASKSKGFSSAKSRAGSGSHASGK